MRTDQADENLLVVDSGGNIQFSTWELSTMLGFSLKQVGVWCSHVVVVVNVAQTSLKSHHMSLHSLRTWASTCRCFCLSGPARLR